MSKQKDDANPPVTKELCEAYRKVLANQIGDLKDDIKSINGRLWWILGSVVVLGIVAIVIALVT